jgi:hypothetical protein
VLHRRDYGLVGRHQSASPQAGGGANRSEAIRQAVLEAAMRRERLAEMKRAFLRRPMPTPDGVNLADDIACEREGA